MAAGAYNLRIEQCATFTRTIAWATPPVEPGADPVPIDLTGYTARLTIANDSGPVLTLTTGSGITIDGPAGTITITLSAAETADLPDTSTQPATYDLLLTAPSSGPATRLVQGIVVIDPAVTTP